MAFVKATKKQARLRLALIGPSGSGKTYTALNIAKYLGGNVAVIDTERGSASKYAHKFNFDVMELEAFHPQRFIDGIKEAEAAGYAVLIIDSLSHAWMGKDGALEQVDKAAKRSQSSNSFAAWREVTPLHNALVDAMLQSRCHIIVTMRAKTEYVLETNERGKQVPKKVGMAPVQRDGLEYEFDVVADMDLDNNLIVSKTRCEALVGAVINKPGQNVAETLKAWLTDGAPAPAEPPAGVPPKAAETVKNAAEKLQGLPGHIEDAQQKFEEAKQGAQAVKAEQDAAASDADTEHLNKNEATTAACKSIYILAHQKGLSDKTVKELAAAFIKQEHIDSLYDLGPDAEPYREFYKQLKKVAVSA